jgi:hypothetical protein
MASNRDFETKNINAILILEIIGKPAEYLVETLDSMLTQLGSEPKTVITSKKINEPVQMKENPEFYTTFAEVEIEVKEITDLVVLMFKYMPAHVEIVSPELLALTNGGWSDILSEIVRRLHGYEEIVGVLNVEKNILEKKLREVLNERQKETNEEQEEVKEKPSKKTKKNSKK